MTVRKRSLDLVDGNDRAFHRHHESIRVEGRRGHFNDIYISIIPHATENVVFFPGDVQHFDHVMRRGTFKSFAAYSYESMCDHYIRRFPCANVWIIKPRMHAKGVSCYDNFLDNTDGEPSSYGFAFLQLQLLFEHTSALFQAPGRQLTWDLPLHLLGFSRGAIVLNQLITELGSLLHLSTSPTQVDTSLAEVVAECGSISAFFERVESIEWIDGGCNIESMTFPTNESALMLLNSFQHIQLRVLTTPYHMKSPLRPWYNSDLALFQRACPHAQVISCFMDDSPSLQNHFDVLFVRRLANAVWLEGPRETFCASRQATSAA
ncbi:hypothetical protein, variant 3 [Aphanomyces invadans]|uniref:DUF2235 domain-containing protein n=2 Tax=Aphanomyces invadans TaxID=157072 RepID=A0A024T9L0_9STRA|nr:hypothetical protein, variant 2 [Aphanomyces invadans]XP_008881355.1 hypothetical protein, variant 3 [Aphanomyces invadans]ETV90011.1 hypothetical protein, variant 2 [Aphanomyces invadans]ETV90012.1 hypothetical protein, variant 3 [Aphanomyces invadans]|eukprot:XP_008881354.1 hypothetical protein, variant 2 [Aphanomyces invadans]